MCNLYTMTTNQEAIRQLAGAMEDSVGNLEPTLDLYPDRPAPWCATPMTADRLLVRLVVVTRLHISEQRRRRPRSVVAARQEHGPDDEPVLSAIADFQKLNEELARHDAERSASKTCDENETELERLTLLLHAALARVYGTTPRTTAGLLALVRLFMDEDLPGMSGIEEAGAAAICRSVLKLVPQRQATVLRLV